ncbi:WD repeat-containing protein [Crucibulum laeve]|uniref:WD repeat-containing protein n=1 Tax=Crucibulum laeve TaxID=68775 RepID=A0A5C3MFS2_9AGAR|nr:WD repeat-containing protein [Crucibulum laeve]
MTALLYQPSHWSPTSLTRKPSSFLPTDRFRNYNLSHSLHTTLDRVNVLGDDDEYGHKGCVNALSWARDGELLLTAGDDTTVRIWRMDSTDIDQAYPFVCRSVVNTDHRANIFNAHMLPYSSRIVTAAGDKQIRIFDVGTAITTAPDGIETQYNPRQVGVQILRCHEDRVKRIVTEDSPDLFLSVGEDGLVRQHDLRAPPHNCRNGTCPAPLMKVGHGLSTLSLSPLTPYQFVVAGESPYGYLFDRRHSGRVLKEEWGMVARAGEELTTCVRRFARPPKDPAENGTRRRDHITGSRMSASNGHEVLLTYSGDGVYLFSTRDEAQSADSFAAQTPSAVPANSKRCKSEAARKQGDGPPQTAADATYEGTESDDGDGDDEEMEAFIEFEDLSGADESMCKPGMPAIMPRRRYDGARNVATIKDVNFLGPNDELIASGSDDGNFFLWDKASGALCGIYEADSSVVNVIEAHPHLPLVAVSGIDTTVKLFAPSHGPSAFSRMDNAQQIIETNARLSKTRSVRYNFSALLAEARAAMGAEDVDIPAGCTNQ